MPQVLVASHELEVMWPGSRSRMTRYLNALCAICRDSSVIIVETGHLVNYIRAVADHYETYINDADPDTSDNGSFGVSFSHIVRGTADSIPNQECSGSSGRSW